MLCGQLARTLELLRCNQNLVTSMVCVNSFHTSSSLESRIKRTARHKSFWHIKKLNKAQDEPMTQENKDFVQEYIDKTYSGPLKQELAPWARGSWEPGTRRCGAIGIKIGVQPLWLKSGKRILTTMLHIQDNHVIKFTPRQDFDRSYLGERSERPIFTGPGFRKSANVHGYVTVGAQSTDPQKYTKDYCGLFTETGLMPKRHLARFPVTENAVIQPGTPITSAHFSVGQFVDIYGRTMERGFQGVMKRWGFHGMPKTHGTTKSHRRPGCIGSGRDKSRVWPGQKMPGHVGGLFIWQRGIRVWRINHEENVMYVTGTAVQGPVGAVLQICDTKLKAKRWENLKKEGLTGGPPHFPTFYQEESGGDESSPSVPEEEYFHLAHDFRQPTILAK